MRERFDRQILTQVIDRPPASVTPLPRARFSRRILFPSHDRLATPFCACDDPVDGKDHNQGTVFSDPGLKIDPPNEARITPGWGFPIRRGRGGKANGRRRRAFRFGPGFSPETGGGAGSGCLCAKPGRRRLAAHDSTPRPVGRSRLDEGLVQQTCSSVSPFPRWMASRISAIHTTPHHPPAHRRNFAVFSQCWWFARSQLCDA